jgi:uncharacterized cupredoxin-like copper-binding protein
VRFVFFLISVIVAALLAAAGCGAQKQPHRMPDGPGTEPGAEVAKIIQREPMTVAQQMAGQTGVERLRMTDRGFEPKRIQAKTGQTVKLHVVNQGALEHNLMIPRFSIVTSNMKPGAENYVEFTATEKGTWPFFSDATGKQEPGLSGSLEVE